MLGHSHEPYTSTSCTLSSTYCKSVSNPQAHHTRQHEQVPLSSAQETQGLTPSIPYF